MTSSTKHLHWQSTKILHPIIEDSSMTRNRRAKSTSTAAATSTVTTPRSTGWTPLAYPSQALYQSTIANANANHDGITMTGTHTPFQLNPYFPLHKDVILAASRELLILDESIDRTSLEIVIPRPLPLALLPVTLNDNDNGNGNDTTMKTSPSSQIVSSSDLLQKKATTSSVHVPVPVPVPTRVSPVFHKPSKLNNTAVKYIQNNNIHNTGKRKRDCSLSLDNDTTAYHVPMLPYHQSYVQLLFKKAKLSMHAENHESKDEHDDNINRQYDINNDNKDDKNKTKTNKTSQKKPSFSAEYIANTLLQQCINIHPSSKINKSNDENHFIQMIGNNNNKINNKINDKTEKENRNNMNQTQEDDSMKRVRKVSDVDDQATCVKTTTATATTSLTPLQNISSHLAVVAFNLDDHCVDIVDSVKRLVNSNSSNNNNGSTTNIAEDQDALLLELKNDLPKLLDVSIMVESHLRQIALQITDRLTEHFDQKVLREFLGYKSSALKKERILQLMSDFLFDVSHAMFAWEQTEYDVYGTIETSTSSATTGATLSSSSNTSLSLSSSRSSSRSTLDENGSHVRDTKICNSLFDKRALRKIGGFDYSSLLYHAVSIKRLRINGESWADHAKTLAGKKMFRHHFDHQAKVHVGQMRRGQRIRKSRSAFYPSSSLVHVAAADEGSTCSGAVTTTVIARKKGSKSRSSSFTSILDDDHELRNASEGDDTEETILHGGETGSMSMVKWSMPNLTPITVTRQAGKSWGVLLAKEGSMCVVMRVPDPADTNNKTLDTNNNHFTRLQKGDLIVSLRNERNETVNTPTVSHSHYNADVSSDWFSEAVSLFKRSLTLYLDVRRV